LEYSIQLKNYLFLDVIRNIDVRIVTLRQPIENICNQLEVGSPEILDRNDSRIAQAPHLLTKIPQLPVRHF
jgi:hypothetical protein